MCGILAVFFKSTPVDLKKIIQSGKYLSNRGPDKTRTLMKSNGIYIFHRLSINDLSETGMQPFISKNIIMMEVTFFGPTWQAAIVPNTN